MSDPRSKIQNPKSRQGFSLVEVTLALGIASFCLLAIFGLLPVGVTSNQASLEQTAAAGIVAAVNADLEITPITDPASDQSSPKFAFTIPMAGGSATGAVPQTVFLREDGVQVANPASGNARYRVSLWFTPPPASQKKATVARILITWPAVADPDPATAPSKFSGSLETITALDRN
jgi:uncharacterized protein (TIGR02598 family)